MATVETEIDSIRVTAISPERMLILKQKGLDCYLPLLISPHQADIIAAQLQGQSEKSVEADRFLADINATDTGIKCITIYREDNTFHARLLLSRCDQTSEVNCPIGVAIALACRAKAPILIDEALFDNPGVHFTTIAATNNGKYDHGAVYTG